MNLISEFQSYMKTMPLGVPYINPSQKDGKMDDYLKFAITELENKIAEIINNKSVCGLILSSDNCIKTTVNDIKNAVNLIVGFQKNSQALVENLDNVINEPIQSSEKQMITDDELLEQFQSVTDSQQIGLSQIDPVSSRLKIEERFMKLAKFI